MQHIRGMVLLHVRLCCCQKTGARTLRGNEASFYRIFQKICMSTRSSSSEQLTTRLIELVKKYDKIDADKVTEKADFVNDLSLDSLDRVELVMVIEQEFSIDIPDNEAHKLACCANIIQYILSQSQSNASSSS